jgi:hypothetical protein
MGAGIGIHQQQGRDDGSNREWLMEAKERGGGCKGARKEQTKPWALYLYPGGRPMGGSSEEASKVSAFNAIT